MCRFLNQILCQIKLESQSSLKRGDNFVLWFLKHYFYFYLRNMIYESFTSTEISFYSYIYILHKIQLCILQILQKYFIIGLLWFRKRLHLKSTNDRMLFWIIYRKFILSHDGKSTKKCRTTPAWKSISVARILDVFWRTTEEMHKSNADDSTDSLRYL